LRGSATPGRAARILHKQPDISVHVGNACHAEGSLTVTKNHQRKSARSAGDLRFVSRGSRRSPQMTSGLYLDVKAILSFSASRAPAHAPDDRKVNIHSEP